MNKLLKQHLGELCKYYCGMGFNAYRQQEVNFKEDFMTEYAHGMLSSINNYLDKKPNQEMYVIGLIQEILRDCDAENERAENNELFLCYLDEWFRPAVKHLLSKMIDKLIAYDDTKIQIVKIEFIDPNPNYWNVTIGVKRFGEILYTAALSELVIKSSYFSSMLFEECKKLLDVLEDYL